MKKLSAFLDGLTESDYEKVQELAAMNMAPSQICEILLQDKWAFMQVWRDQKSRLRKLYELGRLEIEEKKRQTLVEKIEGGDMFAIQLHDKKARAQRFEDIKNEVFNLGE